MPLVISNACFVAENHRNSNHENLVIFYVYVIDYCFHVFSAKKALGMTSGIFLDYSHHPLSADKQHYYFLLVVKMLNFLLRPKSPMAAPGIWSI
jgi:hypothetical protein